MNIYHNKKSGVTIKTTCKVSDKNWEPVEDSQQLPIDEDPMENAQQSPIDEDPVEDPIDESPSEDIPEEETAAEEAPAEKPKTTRRGKK